MRFVLRSHSTQLCLAIVLGCAIGCAPVNPLGRVAISGKITLDGQPLDEGTIQFDPVAGGVGSGAKIAAGSYIIDAAKGLPPGKYLVRIFAPKLPAGSATQTAGLPPGPPGPESNLLGVERVAVKFNAQTTLTAEVLPATESQTIDFEVASR